MIMSYGMKNVYQYVIMTERFDLFASGNILLELVKTARNGATSRACSTSTIFPDQRQLKLPIGYPSEMRA
jgi:hypothetical protein